MHIDSIDTHLDIHIYTCTHTYKDMHICVLYILYRASYDVLNVLIMFLPIYIYLCSDWEKSRHDLYTYIYIYIHTSLQNVYLYVYIYTSLQNVYLYVYIYIYISTNCVYIHIHTYCIYVHIHVYLCIYIYTHIFIYIYIS